MGFIIIMILVIIVMIILIMSINITIITIILISITTTIKTTIVNVRYHACTYTLDSLSLLPPGHVFISQYSSFLL